MKDYLKQQIENIPDSNLARCIVREYLQARVLETLQENGAFTSWAFMGGTALRFLYSMPRFSEDLDFSVTAPAPEDNFLMLMKKAKNTFLAEDYDVTVKAKTTKTVKAAFIKFPGLLYELNLSPLASETISIKVEVDSNPPAGATLETTVIRKHCLLNLQHYDKSSLLAGKLNALLTRKYVKGKDVYDLIWYLSDRTWPPPNILMLNNALAQKNHQGSKMTKENWRQQTAKKVADLDFNKVTADVKPFIEKQTDLQLLTKENLTKLLLS
jgi:predicted nucleotidyltransferase component of viral defense system